MGSVLHKRLGPRYVSIGTAFDRADDQVPAAADSLDGVLASAGVARFLIDLRRPPVGIVDAWLSQRHPMRFETIYLDVRPAEAFDAVVFVERATPGRRAH